VPLVSILVPTYNGERFLQVALDSALSQTHRDIEVVVGDDCSTDGTLELARAFAERDPRLRVLPAQRNLGAAANQIRLHHAAGGAFIKPLLQDDVLAPETVARLLAPLLDDDGVMLATSKRGLIDAAGDALPDQPWTQAILDDEAVLNGTALGDAMVIGAANLVGEVTTALYRAGVVAPEDLWHLGGDDYHAIADIALWLKLLAGARAFYTPVELSWFRQHSQQSGKNAAVLVRGNLEWGRLPLEARAHGYLADPAHEHAALVRAAQVAGLALPTMTAHPDLLDALKGVLARLVERLEELQSVAC